MSCLRSVKDGTAHPRDVKMKMAREITSIFYGENEAAGGRAGICPALPER